jgi:transcriptional regulator with XRE-family HTH domain
MSTLVQNLLYLMQKRGIENPTRLAKASGLPQPTVKRILDGTSTDPRTDTLQQLAEFFGVNVEALRTANLNTEGMGVREPPAANYLPETKAAGDPHPALSIGVQLQHNFYKALPPELHRYADRKVEIQGHAYRFDYCSDNLVAEIGAIFVRSMNGKTRVISTMGATRSLWRLSSYRMMSEHNAPERAFYLFMSVINETDTPLPLATITRVTTEALLHGIQVVVGGVEDAAKMVEAIENNTFKSFSATDDEDDTF